MDNSNRNPHWQLWQWRPCHSSRSLTRMRLQPCSKIHPKTLQRLARNGEICGVHVGKLWRFRVSALNEWLNGKTA